jgi:hypothetical protein
LKTVSFDPWPNFPPIKLGSCQQVSKSIFQASKSGQGWKDPYEAGRDGISIFDADSSFLGPASERVSGVGCGSLFERRLTISARPMSDSEFAQAMREIRMREVSERARRKLARRLTMPR